MVKVLPEPVTPSRVCCARPSSSPSIRLEIRFRLVAGRLKIGVAVKMAFWHRQAANQAYIPWSQTNLLLYVDENSGRSLLICFIIETSPLAAQQSIPPKTPA